MISIHASAKEATLKPYQLQILVSISIHASAKEATLSVLVSIVFASSHFNPRLREGGDICSCTFSISSAISIHASAKEATDNGQPAYTRIRDFNPRLREGGDLPFPRHHMGPYQISIHASAKEATVSVLD